MLDLVKLISLCIFRLSNKKKQYCVMYFTQNTRDYGLLSHAVQPLYRSRLVSIFYDVGVTIFKPYSLI